MNFLLFHYQYIVLSSLSVDHHHMDSRSSVVDKASTSGREISPSPPLIFTRVKKCEILRRFQHHNFEPPAFENAARYPIYFLSPLNGYVSDG